MLSSQESRDCSHERFKQYKVIEMNRIFLIKGWICLRKIQEKMYGQWNDSGRLIIYWGKEMRIEIRTFDIHHIQAPK